MLMFVANLLRSVLYSFSYRQTMPSRYEIKNVNIALQVLRTIVPSSQVEGDPTYLRLALRVILTHVTDSRALVEFWNIATNKQRLAHQEADGRSPPNELLQVRVIAADHP